MKNILESVKNDFSSSLVVFLVALPLCMGIALASGVSPIAGLLSGIIGGIVIGVFSGAPLQVSGPAAGLVVIVFGIVKQDGIAGLALATMIGGVIQLVAGGFKKGEVFQLIPSQVINGMLMGIGTLILFSQLHTLFDQSSSSSFLGNVASLGATSGAAFSSPELFVLPILAFVVLFGWPIIAEKTKLKIPAQLMAIIIVSVVGFFIPFQVKMVEIADDVLAHIGDNVLWKNFDGFTLSILLDGFILGAVASAESMLSTGAIKSLRSDADVNYSKELFAQGIGNTLAGLFGALPITGVIVRTTANCEAGAKTRASAIMHGLWLLLFVAFGTSLLAHIPLSALAAILILIGYKLMKPKVIFNAIKDFNYENFTLLATWLGIIFIDLLSGVCLGIALAALKAAPVQNLFKSSAK